MLAEDFKEEVTIKEGNFEDFFPKLEKKLAPFLKKYFSTDTLEVYSVERAAQGLVRPVDVLKMGDDYYVFRAYEKNPANLDLAIFDKAKYQKERAESLMKMGKYYPKTQFIEDENHLYILHEFLFHPICDFSQPEHIQQLMNLIYAASKEGLFLDFNQNHWLFDSETNSLYYVDKDLVSDDLPVKDASISNFSQSLLFMNSDNSDYFIKALFKIKQEGNEDKLRFIEYILSKIEKSKADLENRDQTDFIKDRIAVYEKMLFVLS
ncbi:MAG: hypothetical protein ACTSRU_06845 [Candidatus Hodarchaeales archaeon]